ncbi:Aste57867_19861 [Aphanomyces stellatus]|uniref:Aste57867_19861 protein n=1 Tax=Aphanomyces stellatus TaxID=120398 RepID=A0A485LEA1_9STRA|nr:hypothetical protein As57867_019795 [Aphanomyces stellatus]VFT96559.1 Aste57867_19861 [Aphanomyces stellatus]
MPLLYAAAVQRPSAGGRRATAALSSDRRPQPCVVGAQPPVYTQRNTHVPAGDAIQHAPFDTFEASATAYLQRLYNNDTKPLLAAGVVFLRQWFTSTYAMRYKLHLPPSIATDAACVETMFGFPGQLYYGQGMQQVVCAFLGLNETARLAVATTVYQHYTLIGVLVTDSCLWFVSADDDGWWVYFANVCSVSPAFAWFKLVFRVALSIFILHLLWVVYYSHYVILVTNLRRFDVSDLATA